MQDQRDRGRRKKHHKPAPTYAPQGDAADALWTPFREWLETKFRDEEGRKISPSLRFSMKTFLQTTPFDLEPATKLRWLAIFWEPDCAQMDQPAGWEILKRLYKEAISFSPKDELNYHSYSISARTCSHRLRDNSSAKPRLLQDAETACMKGLEHVPNYSDLHHSLGRIQYERRDVESALSAFERALECDPKNMWAVLFKAHCLNDLERWVDAADAYRAVDKSFFDGPHSWRADFIREQLAFCLYQGGDKEASLALFQRALAAHEKRLSSTQKVPLIFDADWYYEEAAALFPQELGERIFGLFECLENNQAAERVRAFLDEREVV